MYILYQEFIKINYKIEQNKNRVLPGFCDFIKITDYLIRVPVRPFRASFTLSKEVI